MANQQNSRDVSISSLLASSNDRSDTSKSENKVENSEAGTTSVMPVLSNTFQECMAQFQTNIVIPGIPVEDIALKPKVNVASNESSQKRQIERKSLPKHQQKPAMKAAASSLKPLVAKGMSSILSDQVKQFQTNFQVPGSSPGNPNKASVSPLTHEQTDSASVIKPETSNDKKRISKKRSTDEESQTNRRPKQEKSKKNTSTVLDLLNPVAKSGEEDKRKASKSKNATSKSIVDKKAVKSPKNSNVKEADKKKELRPTTTTERRDIDTPAKLLPPAEIIDIKRKETNDDNRDTLTDIVKDFDAATFQDQADTLSKRKEPPINDETRDNKEASPIAKGGEDHTTHEKENLKADGERKINESGKEESKAKEKVKEKDKEVEKEKDKEIKLPTIALNIPLLDPKDPRPGRAELIINVLQLAEEKYGMSLMHPNAKSAIELMDEMLDEEDDGMEEDAEEEEAAIIEDSASNTQTSTQPTSSKKRREPEDLTEEQLAKRHEAKMNRKVGKYDYEDPFIDDEELQWEEEITSTKEGFFVFWGPLVDDRSTTSTKKTLSKSKK